MARVITGAEYERYLALTSRLGVDRTLSPRTMQAYLQHRLYLIEADIQALASRLGIGEPEAGPSWAWASKSSSDDLWASWTSLNYLMIARETLKENLESLIRQSG